MGPSCPAAVETGDQTRGVDQNFHLLIGDQANAIQVVGGAVPLMVGAETAMLTANVLAALNTGFLTLNIKAFGETGERLNYAATTVAAT